MIIQPVFETIYARFDNPDAGTVGTKKRARECLFKHILYPVEHIQYKEEWERKEGEDELIMVSLQHIKHWWPEEMFVYFNGFGKKVDIHSAIREDYGG